jgi:UPF0271 protein
MGADFVAVLPGAPPHPDAIDLNADLGEGMDCDAAILACVSSANIACGGHAGDAESMRTAVRLALQHGVALGAHPSFVDRENFGRSEMHLPLAQVVDMISVQIEALRLIVREEGAVLTHVKPHGALYNQAARDPALAQAIVQAVAALDPGLRIFGLSGGALIAAAQQAGLAVAAEVFADRRYQRDGSLASRNLPGATIEEQPLALAQAMRLVRQGRVLALDGHDLSLNVDSVCLHGDGSHAMVLAQLLKLTLQQQGIAVRALGRAA